MNAISTALKTSGVKLPPTNKRIWLWLHDHPGRTAKEVANAIGVANSTTSSQLGSMVSRGMVTAVSEKHPHRDIQLLRYTTCIREFELLPLPSARRTARMVDVLQSGAELGRVVAVPLAPVPKPLLEVLESYTLKELRSVRDGLNRMFEYLPR
jgi:DNA-binding MarR family transcriptional regulator